MKLNYPVRFGVTVVMLFLAAWFWKTDGVDRGLDLKGGASLTYRLNMDEIPPREREEVLLSTVKVIEERINSLGLRDVKIDAMPPVQFEVQFPGRESGEVERIKTILTRLGRLEFRILAEENFAETQERMRREMGEAYPGAPEGFAWVPRRPSEENPNPRPALLIIEEYEEQKEVKRLEELKLDPEVADNPESLVEVDRQLEDAQRKLEDVLKKNYFTGADLAAGKLGSRANSQGPGQIVDFGMKPGRMRDFEDFTTKNVKKLMAIIIDGKMDSAPKIQSPLPGEGIISGGGDFGFSAAEADDLVTVLRSGSLEVDITLQSEFAIGPSLGEASVKRGIIATSIGFGAVVLFMIGSYLFPGLVAILALLMNLLLVMGALAFAQAQLSLPGIAGLILTVGMAVDANILVFERIREERKLGKSLAAAVKAGYDRAFVTIVDANVTTLFTAVVLWYFTTGQVRGFAATLICGILASMFTALFVTKTIFGWMIGKGWLTDLRMPEMFHLPKLSFMSIRLPMIVGSILLVAAGFFGFEAIGKSKYDIEFIGGQRVVIALDEKLQILDVKARIAKGGFRDATVVSIKSDKEAIAEHLDLATESDSFQITVAAFTQEDRDRVISFIQTEFASELSPEGLRLEGEEGKGTYLVRMSFKQDVDDATVMDLFVKTEGVADPVIRRVAGREAEVTIGFTGLEEQFRESLQHSLVEKELTLTTPMPMKSFVDPQTAQRHRDDAIKAVVISLIFQILYIYFRFHGASFGFAAVIALVHDVLITLGAIALFSSLGIVNVKINLPIIAAILTLIGYSMNDSIVVFDRIRENMGRGRTQLSEVIDLSINQTMSRTLRTSITTLLVVFVLFVVNFGAASVLEGFAFVLIIGVLTGTYSSIFVASPMLLFLPWHYLRGRKKFWIMIALSAVGIVMSLFSGTTLVSIGAFNITVALLLALSYPAYFLLDLVRWLLIEDADRALNRALREQGGR